MSIFRRYLSACKNIYAVNLLPQTSKTYWTAGRVNAAVDNNDGYNGKTGNNPAIVVNTSTSYSYSTYTTKSTIELIPNHKYYLRFYMINANSTQGSINYSCYWPSSTVAMDSSYPLDSDWYAYSAVFTRESCSAGPNKLVIRINNRKISFDANFSSAMLIDLTETYIGRSIPSKATLDKKSFFLGKKLRSSW